MVLDWLEQIAPVIAARGNNDRGWDDRRLADKQVLEVDGGRLVMLHNATPEEQPVEKLRQAHLRGEHADILVTGHTHLERLDYRDGLLQINSGSATHPHQRTTRMGTVGLMEWGAGKLDVRLVRIGHSEGLPNPGIEYAFTRETGVIRLG
jgi:putative phosphoesterase